MDDLGTQFEMFRLQFLVHLQKGQCESKLKKKENNNNKTYLVRNKASDLSDFPGVNTPVELNGHFCYCTFKGSVCKMPVNALKNLQKRARKILFGMIV